MQQQFFACRQPIVRDNISCQNDATMNSLQVSSRWANRFLQDVSVCFPTIHKTRLTCVTSDLLSLPRTIAAFPAAISALPVGGCVPRGARSRAALRCWTISAWCLGVVVEARARSRACGSRGVLTVTGVSRRPRSKQERRAGLLSHRKVGKSRGLASSYTCTSIGDPTLNIQPLGHFIGRF